MRRWLYAVGVSLSTLGAALLFAPWAHPRETISGLIGRWAITGTPRQRRFAEALEPWIDAFIHGPMGVETCRELANLEANVRRVVYNLTAPTSGADYWP